MRAKIESEAVPQSLGQVLLGEGWEGDWGRWLEDKISRTKGLNEKAEQQQTAGVRGNSHELPWTPNSFILVSKLLVGQSVVSHFTSAIPPMSYFS